MLKIRKSNERGAADHGWLKSQHTFSFAEYFSPENMGFRTLRVINEDRIQGGTGFGAHPHKDMEIISYVLKGALEHQDSMGNKAVIRPNEVQRMSAGNGVVHAEFNAQKDAETHFFQIWIRPESPGGEPGYGQKSFASELDSQKIVHVISPDGKNGSIAIKQDANLYISRLKVGESLEHALQPDRGAWIQVVHGKLNVNGTEVTTGDAVALEAEALIKVTASESSELLLFDLK